MKKGLILLLVNALVIGVGFFAYIKMSSGDSKCVLIPDSVAETTGPPPAPASIYDSEDLFDACLGLKGYVDKPFYNQMTQALEKGATPAYVERKTEDDQVIVDACYSQQLGVMLLLTNTSYELGGAAFGVYEYTIKSDAVRGTIHEDRVPYPGTFGARSGKMIKLVNTVCVAEESDGPALCKDPKADYSYDFEQHKIAQ